MADRFPSLDEIDQGQTDIKPTPSSDPNLTLDDPTASDLLARERAALGDDADLFATQDPPAGTTTTPSPAQAQAYPPPATVHDETDLLGGDASDDAPVFASSAAHTVPVMEDQEAEGASDEKAFESAFPAVETEDGITGVVSNAPTMGVGMGISAPPAPYLEEEEEPEPIKVWREKRTAELTTRASISASRKSETIASAQRDVDSFYESYNNRVDKARERARKDAEEFLASREHTAVGGTAWERIAKLVDVSGKGQKGGGAGSGKERFRRLLVDLRKDEGAPGASGAAAA